MVLSSDNKIELIKVNIDNQESIMKKLLRFEKRKALKRQRDEVDQADDEIEEIIKMDKDKL